MTLEATTSPELKYDRPQLAVSFISGRASMSSVGTFATGRVAFVMSVNRAEPVIQRVVRAST